MRSTNLIWAINLIWKLSVLAEVTVAIRLLLLGLGGVYPALLTACCVLPLKSVLLMIVYTPSATNDQLRQVVQHIAPLEWGVLAWVVFELFARWSGSYRGIGRFGKFLLAALLGIALLVSIAGWSVEWQALVFRSNFRIYYILNRFVFATLALFVTGAWLFFRSHPTGTAPNVIRHGSISVVYFGVSALSFLIFTLKGLKFVAEANLAIVIVTTSCFCAWAVLLTRKGQVAPPVQQMSLEERGKIERINEDLLAFMSSFPHHNR